jgi:cysteine synthase
VQRAKVELGGNQSTTENSRSSLLEEIREILLDANLLGGARDTFPSRFQDAICISGIRDLLEWSVPNVADLSSMLQIESGGRVRAIRMDLLPGVPNLKKPVVAGMLLKDIMKGKIPRSNIDTLVDAGNMNTGFALKYYCAKCNLHGFYIMSGLFPEDMLEILRDETFQVVRAPTRTSKSIEEEFYDYLYRLIRKSTFRRNKHCLWHARYGGLVLSPLGRELALTLDFAPDYIVVSIGAGSTLECLCEIQSHFSLQSRKEPKIVVNEHVKSPIFSKILYAMRPIGIPKAMEEDVCMGTYDPAAFRSPPPNTIPHSILGPHFEKANPLLSKDVIQKVHYVQQYNDDEWMKTSHYLECNGLGVGNSSAAHISVATNLANQGYDVLTVIVEPMRTYYKNWNFLNSSPRFHECLKPTAKLTSP